MRAHPAQPPLLTPCRQHQVTGDSSPSPRANPPPCTPRPWEPGFAPGPHVQPGTSEHTRDRDGSSQGSASLTLGLGAAHEALGGG